MAARHPGGFGPLPTASPMSARVLIRVRAEAASTVSHGGPTSLAVVDLDAGAVELLPSLSPGSVSAVVWNCDGCDFLVLADFTPSHHRPAIWPT